MVFVETCDYVLKLNYLMNIIHLLISFPILYTTQSRLLNLKLIFLILNNSQLLFSFKESNAIFAHYVYLPFFCP